MRLELYLENVMPKYLNDDGVEVPADYSTRLVWYSASGLCGYWTDDWDRISTADGIPCCPSCACPGMKCTAEEWFNGAKGFEEANHPRYVEFVNVSKENCGKPSKAPSYLQRYKDWLNVKNGVNPMTAPQGV